MWPLLISIIGALIIAGGAFLAAREGGKRAAKASRDSVRETLKAQEQRDEKRQKEIILGFLQAIEEELHVLWNLYLEEFGVSWKNFEEGKEEVFYVRVSISQDYFTIYHSNADLIGQIPDLDLRRKIVEVYTSLKAIIDNYKINSRLVDEHKKAVSNSDYFAATSSYSELQLHAPKLKGYHDELVGLMEDIFKRLEEQLSK